MAKLFGFHFLPLFLLKSQNRQNLIYETWKFEGRKVNIVTKTLESRNINIQVSQPQRVERWWYGYLNGSRKQQIQSKRKRREIGSILGVGEFYKEK